MANNRTCRLLFALLLICSATCSHAQPLDFATLDPEDYTYEYWYLDTINGQPSGYWHSWMTVRDERIYTGYEEVGVEAHGGEQMHTRTRSEWVETLDYQPISITLEEEAGTDTVTQVYRFTENNIELTSSQNGRQTRQVLGPIEGAYFTSAQVEVALAVMVARGDTGFDLSMINPQAGLVPYRSSYRLDADGGAQFDLADGSAIDASRWVATYSIMPGLETEVWVDGAARCIGVSYEYGGVTVVSRLADASITEMAFDPPELAFLSVVVPDRPIDNVQRQRRIVYELSYDGSDDQVAPVQTLHQSVELVEPGRARVTVNLDAVQPADARAVDLPTEANLAASIRVDHEDEAVHRLAQRAVRNMPANSTTIDTAIRAQNFVTRFLTGTSLTVGDGTASEAARTRSGDCTECAVLLAAILRANNIPSRCVTGLVYTDDEFVGQERVFVYHMWTQAWIQTGDSVGYWMDLDAAMWQYTAGHIALGISNMGDNDQQDNIRLIPLSNGLEISVKETSE